MSLYIHSNPELLQRLKKHSKNRGYFFATLAEAVPVVSDPKTSLSGVYFSPEDVSFSAFRFLEILIAHRPATPVFLFQNQLAGQPLLGKDFLSSLHVRGVFNEDTAFEHLIAPLLSVRSYPESTERHGVKRDVMPGYVSIPSSDFFSVTQVTYDLFTIDESKKIILFLGTGAKIEPEYLKRLIARNGQILVREEDIQRIRVKLQRRREYFFDDTDFPHEWKSSELMVNARALIQEMKRLGVTEHLVENAESMLGDLYKSIHQVSGNFTGHLSQLLEKAGKCDRSVFCAGYAMLVCKQLKYERIASVEILGVASVLQDISLFDTPFGDLSDKKPSALTPEEREYYLKHPAKSSDLLSRNADLPAVTLQVIHQHHERRDRTGFPEQLGGPQIHPMAEILSLVNEYYDAHREYGTDQDVLNYLNNDGFSHYSDNLVQAFRHVLGVALKDKMAAAVARK